MIIISEHSLDEKLLINKQLNIIDLGACLGEFSLGINEQFKLKKSILVEANPTNFNKIPENDNFLKLNRIATFSEIDQLKIFNEDTDSPYNGSTVFNHFSSTLKQHLIKTISLKELIEKLNLDSNEYVDILKIDIEGGEYELLINETDETLLKFKQITVEFHDFIDPNLKNLNNQIEQRLVNLGFSVEAKNPAYFRHGSEHYDVLFLKK
jgi:FkbM family methyltransferase